MSLAVVDPEFGLTKKQLDFCINYVETGDGTQSAIDAGYKAESASSTSTKLLKNAKVAGKIRSLVTERNKPKIATGEQVMEFFTRMMNGEEKDQFGLEVSAGDRIRAAQEIAKRTVDIENRVAGRADAKVEISLKWD